MNDNRQDRMDNRIDNRGNRIDNRADLRDNRIDRRNDINRYYRSHRLNWATDNPYWRRWNVTRPYRWATWGALSGWIGYSAAQPRYYNYGENVYYEGDNVYYNDEVVASTQEYAQQAADIAASAPEVNQDDVEWMNLGVFAVTQDNEASGPDPSLFLQLAVSKEGIISGLLQNTANDSEQWVEGMVDKDSARAAWTVVNNDRPIMETGIQNLTEDTAPALVHFGDGSTQQWLLVRLEDPEADKKK